MSDELGMAYVLARDADPASAPLLRELANHADRRIRLVSQIGLARIDDDDPDPVDHALATEPELAVYLVVVARAARVAISERSCAYLAAQAVYTQPAELRANCVHALAQHDRPRAEGLIDQLDARARELLHAITNARGGALASLLVGTTTELDRIGLLVRSTRP